MKWAVALITLALAIGSPGCCWVDGHSWWNAPAQQAWRSRNWMYDDVPCNGSFKTGFKAGYRFASCGGDSCEPPAPLHYWRINGATDSDRAHTQAWTDGFTHGTLAARQDGAFADSRLAAAAAQPPEGIPDVNYYTQAAQPATVYTPPQAANAPPAENYQFFPVASPPAEAVPRSAAVAVNSSPGMQAITPIGARSGNSIVTSPIPPPARESALSPVPGWPHIVSAEPAPHAEAAPTSSDKTVIDSPPRIVRRSRTSLTAPPDQQDPQENGPSQSAAWQLPILRDAR